jgi:EpsD family peptidyl-prolyl cis-trans isomerase
VKYAIVATLAVCVAVSGCQRKAEGQTVAVVNGEEITVPDLNFALNNAKVPQGVEKDAARSQVLQQLVDRRLLAEQARKEGIDKTPDYLNRERRADEDLLISMLADRRLNTTPVPSDREVDTYIAAHPEKFANREAWDLDQTAYQTPTDPAITKEIHGAKTVDQLVSVLQAHKIPFTKQKSRVDTAMVPAEIYAKLNSMAPGEPFFIAFGNRSVSSSITGREPHPLTGDQAKPVAVDAIRKTQATSSIQNMLKSLKSSAKVDYQSGYAPPKKS